METNTLTAPQDLAAILEANGTDTSARRRRWIIILAIVTVAVLVVLVTRVGRGKAQTAQFVTEAVQRGDISTTVTATGNLKPTNEVIVGSELSGTAREVLVDTNDRVTKGQPLAKLDTRKLTQQTDSSRAAFAAAQARINQAKATLVENEAKLSRAQELQRLTGNSAQSKADMDTVVAATERARADVMSAEAAADEAKAQLQSNETDLAKATITAPIDGTVLLRKLEPGQTVAATLQAPELFVIAENLERMKLNIAVAEADIATVKEGQTATFTVDAWPDRSYTAKVIKAAYGSTVTDNVVTYETELDVPNEDLSLRPGMTATVDIRTAEAKGVLLVPSAALRFDPERASAASQSAGAPKKSFIQSIAPGPGGRRSRANGGNRGGGDGGPAQRRQGNSGRIWVLRDGKPEAITVKTGLTNGRMTEVSGEGVSEGTQVIVRAAPRAAR